jgi:adenosylmethionine-8-amino-7-oxononanoate aminotransferase
VDVTAQTLSEPGLSKEQLAEADQAHLLHPLSRFATLAEAGPLIMASGTGIHLTDVDGRQYIDAFSGLMNVNAGYGRIELAEAARAQLALLAYSPTFFGRATAPTIELARRLAQLSPHHPVWHFTSGGSEANETALKLARLHFASRDLPEKRTIISRLGGYHGVTYGALSATAIPSYHSGFGNLPGEFTHIAPDSASALEEAILDLGPAKVAAFLMEPVSLPGGMWIPGQEYFDHVRAICDRYDVLFIVDEVVTGFGRTGRMFAIEHWNARPDMITIAKGITSGYAPLGAVGMRREIADVIKEGQAMLMHGVTASGHPAACAVALRNIRLIEEEGLAANAARAGGELQHRLTPLAELEGVHAVRNFGLLVAIDFVADGAPPTLADRAERQLFTDGVLARSYGGFLALGPPLTISEEETRQLADKVARAVERVVALQ